MLNNPAASGVPLSSPVVESVRPEGSGLRSGPTG